MSSTIKAKVQAQGRASNLQSSSSADGSRLRFQLTDTTRWPMDAKFVTPALNRCLK
jgi:nitrogen fixation protein FixH